MATRRRHSLPLAQAVKEYLDWQALDRGRSPNTVRAYAADLAGFQKFAAEAGVKVLAGIDRDLLRAFQSDIARAVDADVPLSPQTRHRRLVALRSFLRFCAREQWDGRRSRRRDRPAEAAEATPEAAPGGRARAPHRTSTTRRSCSWPTPTPPS